MLLLAAARSIVPTSVGTPLLIVDTFTDPPDELVNPTSSQASDVLRGDTSRTSIVPPGRVLVKHRPSIRSAGLPAGREVAPVGVTPEHSATAAMGRPPDAPDLLWNRIGMSAPSLVTSKVAPRSWSMATPGLTTGRA